MADTAVLQCFLQVAVHQHKESTRHALHHHRYPYHSSVPADHVGSFLRPRSLKEARLKARAGQMNP